MCPDNRSLPRTQPGAVPYLRLIGLVLSFALSWTKEIRGLSENDKNRRESPVSLFDCSYLLLRTVLNQRKQEEDVKIITAEGKKSHISAGMSTFSSNLCPFAPSCLQQKKKNVFLKNCVKKFTPTYLWRYYFLVHASPHLDQKMGIKKSPLSVCLSLFWQPEKKIKHKDKKKHEKSLIYPFSSSNCPRFAPSRTETSQAPVVVWDCDSVTVWDADSDRIRSEEK